MPSPKQSPGLLWWLTGGGLVLLAVILVGLPSLLSQRPDLAARLEAATADGWFRATNEDGLLEVDRAFGRVMKVRWQGQDVPDERVFTENGIVTVLSPEGNVECSEPLPSADMAEWLAASPWKRLGVFVQGDGQNLTVVDVRPGSPADTKGLVPGDRITHLDGRPAVGMGLRAALLVRIAGGSVAVSTADGRNVSLVLDPLMPAELLAQSHDPLGDYRVWLGRQEP